MNDTKIKEIQLEKYLSSVINNQTTLIDKYGKLIDEKTKKNVQVFMQLNEFVLKYKSKEEIESIKSGGDLVLSVIPENRKKEHKEMNDKNYKFDEITQILLYHENLLKLLK
ncbi:hypothetical protein [Olleya marilimosa]|uniref:hypothetical protein n=1 Tax=Olleya marilimosa TaxID=272164 RepID=UPI00047FB1BF|nr:hypothetical protein [Olleya marilimosa]